MHLPDGGANTPGDFRAFLAPFAAHDVVARRARASGRAGSGGAAPYRFMVYADDDTLVNAAVRQGPRAPPGGCHALWRIQ